MPSEQREKALDWFLSRGPVSNDQAAEIFTCAAAWYLARKAAIAAPMGDKAVWSDLADAETALSKAVYASGYDFETGRGTRGL